MSTLELAHERADHAATGHAERVAECDGTALRVQLFFRHAELLDAVGRLAGESLVNLENVDVVNCQATVLQSCWDSVCGSNAHDLWRDTGDSKAHNTAVNAAT